MPYEAIGMEIVDPEKARGCVEVWLDQLEDVMRKSIAYIFDENILSSQKFFLAFEKERAFDLVCAKTTFPLIRE